MPKYAFFKGDFVPIEEAKVSIMTHAFNSVSYTHLTLPTKRIV